LDGDAVRAPERAGPVGEGDEYPRRGGYEDASFMGFNGIAAATAHALQATAASILRNIGVALLDYQLSELTTARPGGNTVFLEKSISLRPEFSCRLAISTRFGVRFGF
jgi:hypothetical protein